MSYGRRRIGVMGAAAAVAALVAIPAAAFAAPAGPSGADIAKTGVAARAIPACQSCHGLNGEGQAEGAIPRLAGLDAGYIERQLGLFAAGSRRNPMMSPVAGQLTPADRSAVAAYYGGLPTRSLTPQAPTAGGQSRGQQLAQTGRWSANIPPCASCHGADGLGVGASVPALSAQPASYIVAALNDWRGGGRSGDPLGLMKGIAARLSPGDIADVAAYYAARPAAASPSGPAKTGKAR